MRRESFTLSKTLVAQVRYYEHLFIIKDEFGDRVYTGTDEKAAKLILKTLRMYRLRESNRKRGVRRKRRTAPKRRTKKKSRRK